MRCSDDSGKIEHDGRAARDVADEAVGLIDADAMREHVRDFGQHRPRRDEPFRRPMLRGLHGARVVVIATAAERDPESAVGDDHVRRRLL